MRSFLAAVLLGTAAAGCSAPATTQTTDHLPKDLNVLFWTQDQRDAAFRTMETVPKVVVNTVKAGGPVYPLPQGTPLGLGADVDAYMAQQRNAGLIIVQDGTVRFEVDLSQAEPEALQNKTVLVTMVSDAGQSEVRWTIE